MSDHEERFSLALEYVSRPRHPALMETVDFLDWAFSASIEELEYFAGHPCEATETIECVHGPAPLPNCCIYEQFHRCWFASTGRGKQARIPRESLEYRPDLRAWIHIPTGTAIPESLDWNPPKPSPEKEGRGESIAAYSAAFGYASRIERITGDTDRAISQPGSLTTSFLSPKERVTWISDTFPSLRTLGSDPGTAYDIPVALTNVFETRCGPPASA
jgi:hypothetical protein